jgi:hypothetical protein
MPRPRYRQDPLPIGPDAPPVELFGPEQPNPPGLELMQQRQLEVVPMGPLFEKDREEEVAGVGCGRSALSGGRGRSWRD